MIEAIKEIRDRVHIPFGFAEFAYKLEDTEREASDALRNFVLTDDELRLIFEAVKLAQLILNATAPGTMRVELRPKYEWGAK